MIDEQATVDVAWRLRSLLRGDPPVVARWLDERSWRWTLICLAITTAGAGLYGSTLGLWHAPRQGFYTAIKFPLVVFLTAAGNAILNGMLAQLLGTRLRFRQTSLAILMSFTVAALILAACSPLMLFLLVNTPSLSKDAAGIEGGSGHGVMLASHVAIIAFAGIVANCRLFGMVEQCSPDRATALRTLFAWLAGNLLFGSQIAWILRPFIGSPNLPIEFLRPDPFYGNFFESIAQLVGRFLDG